MLVKKQQTLGSIVDEDESEENELDGRGDQCESEYEKHVVRLISAVLRKAETDGKADAEADADL